MMSDVINLLCSPMKLERDKGVGELQRLLPTCNETDRIQAETQLIKLLGDTCNSWETKHGCLLGAKCIIPYVNLEHEYEAEFVRNIQQIAERLLTDVEVRVRLTAGEVLGALCAKCGSGIYQETKDYVLNLVRNNLERQPAEDDASRQEQLETERLMEKLAGPSQRRNSAEAAILFHDTAGWKNLETSLKCLQSMIDGCGTNFQPFVDEELLDIMTQILNHSSHFVRETGFFVCASLVGCGDTNEDTESRDSVTAVNPIFTYGHDISKHLAKGLADNWSQVRLSASVAARKFLLSLPNENTRETFYPELIPRMCLNRYYVAEGVRIYSQETWRQVAGAKGKDLVEKYISSTVVYYITATRSDNHAVREAACACIAELAAKIQPQAVKPHIEELLNSLMRCFSDNCWPVRDAACLACGNFVQYYSAETRPVMHSLYPMFFCNLQDPISSVRQGAACSLGSVVRAYGEEGLETVMDKIMNGLRDIRNQPQESEKFPELDRLPSYPVIKRQCDLEDNAQFSEIVSSSHISKRSGLSEIHHKFSRPSQPWELADGCLYLLTELSQIPDALPSVMNAMPLVAEACHYRHYVHHVIFLETLCKQLPILGKGLGKKAFRSVVDDFLEPIFYALECESALTSSAASQCLNQLGSLLGPSILRAKVERHNPSYLQHLDANVHIAPF